MNRKECLEAAEKAVLTEYAACAAEIDTGKRVPAGIGGKYE